MNARAAVSLVSLVSIAALTGCGGGGGSPAPGISPTPAGTSKIAHIVVIFQENRTPDNLFHGLPGADIANSGLNSAGQTIALQPIPLANTYDLDHSHTGFVTMYDGGKMDGANNVRVSCNDTGNGSGTPCPYPNPQYGYVPSSDNAPYMQLAQQYTFGDRMFQTNEGPSFPAHQFMIAGTSEPAPGSPLLASENPMYSDKAGGAPAGCDAPSDALVALIDPSGSEATTAYPCFDHPTLMDSLDAAHVSWRYYTSSVAIWEGPNAISHIFNGPDWAADVQLTNTQIFSDISSGQLAQMSWVIPTAADSDHAQSNKGLGPSWVSSIVNAIGQSPYWQNTAIFIVWDDWGGWYDHVPPQILGSYELGFRVPLIVVSPYAKHGYVSHRQHEFGSILKFAEETFHLPSLNTTDARADDLSDCFDFTQSPAAFRTIVAPHDARWFLAHPLPAVAPDDDL